MSGGPIEAGTRIRLTATMREDPDPVAAGSTGMIVGCSGLDGPLAQVRVAWDDGRRLSLLPDQDCWEEDLDGA